MQVQHTQTTGKHSPTSVKSRKMVLLADLKACTSLQKGRAIHAEAVKCSFDSCVYVATALVRMYAKCASMLDAQQVFDGIKHPDVVAWTALVSGYADNGKGLTALELFARMRCDGFAPNSFTFVSAFKACTSLALEQDEDGRAECLRRGKQLCLEMFCYSSIHVQNTLIDMFSKCGSMTDAQEVFNTIKNPDAVSWNSLIFGYAENGDAHAALDLFTQMKAQGCVPDAFTFVAVLKACTLLALQQQDETGRTECLQQGKQIHSGIGCHSNAYVRSSLIDMYAKCGSMVDARRVFDSVRHPEVVSWNALLLGYADNGEGASSLDLFARMKAQRCKPDSFTYVAVLKSCSSLAVEEDESKRAEYLSRGEQIHSEIGDHADAFVQSTLIDMYAKYGKMVESRRVFDSINHLSVVSWTALILGYAENGECATSLDMFGRMRSLGYAPNCITFVAAFKACAVLGALECGRKIHAEMDPRIEGNAMLVTCLVDFYAKCGSLAESQEVFDSHPGTRNLTSWNALLTGYGCTGDDEAAFALFQGMRDAGVHPDGITFLSLLTCCSHAGLVERAMETFEEMNLSYGIAPSVDHYNCMLDMLGRSKRLDDAMALLRGMPCRPDVVTWVTSLGACRRSKNVGLGTLVFKSLVSLDDTNAAAYLLMGQIYASKGMWREQAMVLSLCKKLSSRSQV